MNTKTISKTMLIILFISVVLTACAPSTGQKKTIALEPLYSGTWYLVAYGNDDNTAILTPGLRLFMAFQQDGSLSGNAGCNNFFGTFTATEDGSFSVNEPLGSSLMFCENGMDEEAAFLAAIQSAEGFFFNENDQLVINFKDSSEDFDFMLFINQQNAALLGTGWVLSTLVTPDGEHAIPPASAPLLNLSEDDSMTGNGGCNTIFSDFTAEDGRISFGTIASSMMFCEGLMELEASYMLALEEVSRYEIIGDRLVLSDDQNSTVLTFFTTAFMLEETQWRLYVLNGETIPEMTVVTLTLSPEGEELGGTVFGSAGCNRYSGNYTREADRVNINILALTAMECESGMDIEASFLAALQEELTFQIQFNRLILTSENNALLFLGEAPSLAGNWRLNRMGTPDDPVEITFDQTILAEFEVWEGSVIGSITGSTRCYEYSARFFTDREFITFDMQEMKALDQCSDGTELDDQFFEALKNAAQYQFSQGNLILFDDQGIQLLEFAPQF
jgi:heat shock protein HslJ